MVIYKPASIVGINNTVRALARKRPPGEKPHVPPSFALRTKPAVQREVSATWILDYLKTRVGIEVNVAEVGDAQLDTIRVA